MPPTVYGRGWRRPNRCECDKIPYRDEAAALAAAEGRGADAGIPLTVYKCPGSTSWHLTGRGFHPRSLKTRPRIMAWYLSARRVMSFDGLCRQLGVDPACAEGHRQRSSVSKVLRTFADLSLVRLDDPHRSYVTAVDFDGLRRVMQVGLQEYAEAHGMSVIRPPQAVLEEARRRIEADPGPGDGSPVFTRDQLAEARSLPIPPEVLEENEAGCELRRAVLLGRRRRRRALPDADRVEIVRGWRSPEERARRQA
jgi:hypothetical protein